ncbi:kelch domain-containing protein 4-like [Mytilus edulis]|uniref:kelch domain-containing protein 4-like n=1 Tax=Mytilus edulis TaxID=6550 RepID=UPI0039F046B1
MGKKNKKDKQGKGKEKTDLKTEKNAAKRAKKDLASKGEDDIEKLIAEFQEQDKSRTQVIEEKCAPPSPRSNTTLNAHPDKDELIMFGGEFFTGSKMYMYNDLLFYNIKKNEWTKVTAPNAPPPRSSHQAVTLKQGGGQLWIFGGEFASPTQSQFYHYKELWVFHLKDKRWEKIRVPGSPSSRSGHRMVICKKQLIVFGGFHDNVRDYKYFNDAFAFNFETYSWDKLEVTGNPPAPRSGFMMGVFQDIPKAVVYGGYSKERIKKDVDKGTIHTDMFVLCACDAKKKDDSAPMKWRWVHGKQSGNKPSPRCGMPMVTIPGNKAVCFGGVFDEEEDEEQLEGRFYNDMYMLDMEKGKWFSMTPRGKKDEKEKKKRRREKENDEDMEEGGEEDSDNEENENVNTGDENEATQEIKKLKLEEEKGACAISEEVTEGVFTIKVGPQSSTSQCSSSMDMDDADLNVDKDLFVPSPRMGSALTVKNSTLYLYGGTYESGDKQWTLSDLYSIDLHKMDEWRIIIQDDEKGKVCEDSDSSDDEDKPKTSQDMDVSDDDDDDEDDDDLDDILEGCDVPKKNEDEPVNDYFERTKEFWLEQSEKYFKSEDMSVSKRTIQKFAKEMCTEYSKK